MKNILLNMVLVIILTGCATVGTKINPDKLSLLQEGVTTKQEVLDILGNPIMVNLTSDSKEVLMYQWVKTKMRASNFVPVVGLLNGGADTEQEILQILINENGVMEKYVFSKNNMSINSGLLNTN